jgi:uncharacterized RDD family membrane protein YckC
MTGQPPPGAAATWQAPTEAPGPAPGVAWAGYGERLVAYIVDGLILGVVFMLLTVFLASGIVAGLNISDPSDPQLGGIAIAAIVLYVVAIFVVTILYFPTFWATRGQTPGMRLFGIRVVHDSDGTAIGWGTAVLRLLGYWVSGFFFSLGYIWMFFDSRRRGWHDLIAGTVVVKDAPR